MPRPRKGASLHALHGTARSNTVTNPLRFSIEQTLKPSSWLPTDAKKLFRNIIKFLEDSDTAYLSKLDSAALESFCVNYVQWKDAEKLIAQHGSLIEVPILNRASGNITGYKTDINPAVRLSQLRQSAMLKAVAALGFDPRSRGSIDTTPVKTNRPRTKQYDEDDEDAPVGWRDTYEIR